MLMMEKPEGIIHRDEPVLRYDAIDKKILGALANNMRLSPTSLGKIVKLSKDGVRYRIQRLIASHTLLGGMLCVHPYIWGFQHYFLTFDISNPPPERKEKMMIQLAAHPNTIWVGTSIGAWNLVIVYFAKNHKVTDELKEMCKPYIKRVEQLECTATHTYLNVPLWFLQETATHHVTQKRMNSSFQKIISRPTAERGYCVDIDRLDINIIQLLSRDVTTSLASLAKTLSRPFNTIKKRIEKLITKNVILAFDGLINIALLGHYAFSASIELSNDQNAYIVLEHLKHHPATGHIYAVQGAWNVQWYGSVRNNIQLHAEIETLRTQFPQIKNIDVQVLVKDYKLTFTPDCIFK
jgi:DNA-binding Lrp family transcriptional regulator